MTAHTPDYHAAIVGTGLLGAPGIGNQAVWQGLQRGNIRPELRHYELHDGNTVTYPVYAAPSIKLEHWVPKSTRYWLEQEGLHRDKDFLLLLVAALLAIEDADLAPSEVGRAAFIVGHENLGVNPLIDRLLQSKHELFSRDCSALDAFGRFKQDFFRLQSFPYLFYLAKSLGIQGPTYTINNACASGLYGLELGRQLVHQGQADTVIVVGGDYAHATEYLWLGDKGFHSRSQTLKPFDVNRDGSVLGDGAAAIVLKHPNATKSQKRTPIAGYWGGAFRQEGWSLGLPNVVSRAYSDTIVQAMESKLAQPPDLLIPHGTGIQMWDAYEGAEIIHAFAKLNWRLPTMTALKGYFGHTLGANTLLEVVCMLHVMQAGEVPPAAGFEKHQFKTDFPINSRWKKGNICTAVKTVSAFGGFLAAGVFKRY